MALSPLQSIVADTAGNAEPGVAVTLTRRDSASFTMYRDAGGTDPYGSNVVTTDAYGRWLVYAPDGLYDASCTLTRAGQTRTYYLNVRSTFTAGTANAYGRIEAIRVG